MKKLLGILFILISVAGFSQVDTNKVLQKNNAYGYEWNNMAVNGFIRLPRDSFKLKYSDYGSVVYVNGQVYVWTGTRYDSVGKAGGGSGGGGGTAGVTSFAGRDGTVVPVETDYQSFYPLLGGSYSNPSWINSLPWSKITGAPTFVQQSQLNDTAAAIRGSYPVTQQKLNDTAAALRAIIPRETGNVIGGSWRKLSDSVSIHARDGAELVYVPSQDSIYMFGGWHRDSIPASTKQVYKYDRNMQHARRLPDAPWAVGLHCFGISPVVNDTIFVWGGDAENPTLQPQYWAFKVSTNTWTLLRNNIISARFNYASVWHNGRPYVMGGLTQSVADSNSTPNDVIIGPRNGNAWSTIATGQVKFGGIYSGTAASFNGYIYVIGGVQYALAEDGRVYKKSVWRSLDGITWERRADIPFQTGTSTFGNGRGFVKVVPSYDGKHLGVFFGYQRIPAFGIYDFKDSYVMDIDENWTQLATDRTTMDTRHAAAVTAVPDGWVIATGFLDNDAWKITIADNIVRNEGNRFGASVYIGSRDSNNVHLLMNDTARLSVYRDTTVLRQFLRIYDARVPDNDNDHTMLGLFSQGGGARIRFANIHDTLGTLNYNASGFQLNAIGTGGDPYGWNFSKSHAATFGYIPYTDRAIGDADNQGGFLQINTAGGGQSAISVHPVAGVATFRVSGAGYIVGNNLQLNNLDLYTDTSLAKPLGVTSSGAVVRTPYWPSTTSTNIYNSNGSISSTRTVTANNDLTIEGTGNIVVGNLGGTVHTGLLATNTLSAQLRSSVPSEQAYAEANWNSGAPYLRLHANTGSGQSEIWVWKDSISFEANSGKYKFKNVPHTNNANFPVLVIDTSAGQNRVYTVPRSAFSTGGGGTADGGTIGNTEKTGYTNQMWFPAYDTTLALIKPEAMSALWGGKVDSVNTDSSMLFRVGVDSFLVASRAYTLKVADSVRALGGGGGGLSGLLSTNIPYANSSTTIARTGTGTNGIYWDATNNRIGIQQNTPQYTLDVSGVMRATSSIISDGSVSVSSSLFQSGVYTQATATGPYFRYTNNWTNTGSFEWYGKDGTLPLLRLSGTGTGTVILPTLAGNGAGYVAVDNSGNLSWTGGGFINNSTSAQSGANFNIGGDGIIGGALTVGGIATINGSINNNKAGDLNAVFSSSGGAANFNVSSGVDYAYFAFINTGSNAQTWNLGTYGNKKLTWQDVTNNKELMTLADNTGILKLLNLSGGTTGSIVTVNSSGELINSGTVIGQMPKLLTTITTDVGNVGSGEDDLITYSVPGGTLANNGDFLEFEMNFNNASNANAKTITLYFGSGSFITLPSLAFGGIQITGKIMRTGAATQEISVSMVSSNSGTPTTTSTTTATLSSSNTLKATGTAVADNDIVMTSMTVKYFPKL